MRTALTLLSVLAFLFALAGCRTMSTLGEEIEGAAPASSASVDQLRKDHDAAIQAVVAAVASGVAQLRADMDAADGRIRADAAAADEAQRIAMERASAEGKTWVEAAMAGLAARTEQAAQDASAAASLAITKAGEAKTYADAKAGELKAGLDKAGADAKAAREESEGGLPWWGEIGLVLAGLLPASWGVKKIIVGAIRAFDAQPFRNSRGDPVPEERLADLASAPPATPKPAV